MPGALRILIVDDSADDAELLTEDGEDEVTRRDRQRRGRRLQ